MSTPTKSAAALIEKLGPDEVRLLLDYQAAEQSRAYVETWERAQMGTQKHVLPLVLCGMMLVLVLPQHFAVLPELTYRGRR